MSNSQCDCRHPLMKHDMEHQEYTDSYKCAKCFGWIPAIRVIEENIPRQEQPPRVFQSELESFSVDAAWKRHKGFEL